MLNRLTSTLPPAGDSSESSSHDWDMDEQPNLRLAILCGVIVATVFVVGARLAYVQGCLAPAYAVDFEKTTERLESIASRHGRISSAEGEVLAQDVEVFNIYAHYRVVEDPPDPAWLKQQALTTLERAARRDPVLVAARVNQVLDRRQEMWQRLTELIGADHTQLAQQRRDVQRRVERIIQFVERERLRAEASQPAHQAGAASSGAAGHVATPLNDQQEVASWWRPVWKGLVKTLTTPPERQAVDPVIVREQLDYHLIAADVPQAAAIEVETHPELYPGLRVELSTRRVYPHGTLAPHLVGYRAPIDEKVLKQRAARFPQGDPLDYRSGDRVGRTGLELYYERHLRGLRGLRKLTLNRRGEVIRTETVREPRPGQDLVLTLNLPLQASAERLLDTALHEQAFDIKTKKPLPIPPGGSIVALDIRTGAVLAAASAPGFDLNLFVQPDGEAWRQIQADPRTPLFPRVTRMTLPPGSVFKVLSAVAFVQSGRLDPEAHFFCQGYLNDPDHYRCYTYTHQGVGHAEVNLVDALARSCNVYFFDAARRVGPVPLHDWAERFGFGQPTGIDLPGERGGNLPKPRFTARGAKPVTTGDTLRLAIGQARLTVTPLQIARLLAAVANGGQLVTPHLVESAGPRLLTEDSEAAHLPDGVRSLPTAEPIAGLSRRTLEWVRMGLQQVVAHPQGTGYKTVRMKEVLIAGKTGTAEAGGNRPDHAWFAGYIPADQPRIAFVVVLEHAGSGGHAAGPVARKFVQEMLDQGLIGISQPPRNVRAAN